MLVWYMFLTQRMLHIHSILKWENNIFIIRVHVYYFTIRMKVNSVFSRASIIVYNFAGEVLSLMYYDLCLVHETALLTFCPLRIYLVAYRWFPHCWIEDIQSCKFNLLAIQPNNNCCLDFDVFVSTKSTSSPITGDTVLAFLGLEPCRLVPV